MRKIFIGAGILIVFFLLLPITGEIGRRIVTKNIFRPPTKNDINTTFYKALKKNSENVQDRYPIQMGPLTKITKSYVTIEDDKRYLTQVFEVDKENFDELSLVKQRVLKESCSNPQVKNILKHDIVVMNKYYGINGTYFGSVSYDKDVCDNFTRTLSGRELTKPPLEENTVFFNSLKESIENDKDTYPVRHDSLTSTTKSFVKTEDGKRHLVHVLKVKDFENLSNEDLDFMKHDILNGACSNPQVKNILKHDIIVTSLYYGTNDKYLGSISYDINDCNKITK